MLAESHLHFTYWVMHEDAHVQPVPPGEHRIYHYVENEQDFEGYYPERTAIIHLDRWHRNPRLKDSWGWMLRLVNRGAKQFSAHGNKYLPDRLFP